MCVDNWIVTTGEVKLNLKLNVLVEKRCQLSYIVGLEYLCFLLVCVWEAKEKKIDF